MARRTKKTDPVLALCGHCGAELRAGDPLCCGVPTAKTTGIATDEGGRSVTDEGGRPVQKDAP